MSDLHWDNPKCDRELLKRDLDWALENKVPVIINGDLFCLMQGKYDPRRSKDDIREEHNVANYLDAIVTTAAEWFKPYVHNIYAVGYGNHETSVLKNCESDILRRWADVCNLQYGSNIQVGGYGGWLTFKFSNKAENQGSRRYSIKYFHGAGGGGPVTRGTIQNQRMLAQVEGADCIWMGHVHEAYTMVNVVEGLNHDGNPHLREVLQVRTPTYKEEYADGTHGFHVERGRPPKPLGCYVLEMTYYREGNTRKLSSRAYRRQ